jgi:cation:H+ antiporter
VQLAVILVLCAAVIYIACEFFVNAVEWLGQRLRVGPVAVGSILAAVGTALPESIVTAVAVTSGGPSGAELAQGAAMGGPLVVGTIAYAVVGVLLVRRGTGRLTDLIDTRRLAHDQAAFLLIFIVKVTLGLVAFAMKPWCGVLFFAAYGWYLWRELRTDHADPAGDPGLEPLKVQPRRASPQTWAIVAQTLVALIVVFAASQIFVTHLAQAGPALGLPDVTVALLLSPLATELPEVLNAVIWVRQGKTELALANISGSMMIQATVPSGIAIGFTAWDFTPAAAFAGLATMAAIAYLWGQSRRDRLTARTLRHAGLAYLAFALAVVIAA